MKRSKLDFCDMQVINVVEDYDERKGGVPQVVHDLANNLIDYFTNIGIFYVKGNGIETDERVKLLKCGSLGRLEFWTYSKYFKETLLHIIEDSYRNIFHIHGVWMYPQYIASKIAYKNNIPYIISFHGMFEPWLWNHGYLKKKLYFNLLIKKYFSNASVLHAITLDEKDNLYKLFKHKNIETIPNSIYFNEIQEMNIKCHECEKYILFLGRIDKKKGIDILIKAFSFINDKQVVLKIVGPKNEYQKEIEMLVESLGLKDRIQFLGVKNGVEKYQLYKNAWVFVAPSYSEVVGMVNLEAAAVATPVVTTFQTGLLKEWNNNGGVLINPCVEDIMTALNNALSWSCEERNDRGKKLQEFVFENYSWEKNIYKWIDLYRSLQ